MNARFLIVVSAALHLYVAVRLVPSLPAPWGLLLAVVMAISAVLMPMGMLAWRFFRGPNAERVAIAGLIAMGLFSSMLVGTFLRDVLLIAFGIAHAAVPAWFMFSRLESAS